MRAFLGLGANIGNREANVRLAVRWLARECTVVAVSSLYRSEAVVPEGAPPGPGYLNAVCEVETALAPEQLLRFLKGIEYEIGRRPAARWAPRVIDIDILLYGDAVIDTPELTVPHKLLAGRHFVVVPLAELAPDTMHPVLHKTIGELAEDIDVASLEHLAQPGWERDRWRPRL
jgi:2-amino-4-hydroxy-6-hydroxymethyldihydropteridine diphosphokinase